MIMLQKVAVAAVAGASLVALAPAQQASAETAYQYRISYTSGMGVADRYAPSQDARTGLPGIPEGKLVSLVCWSYGERVGSNGNSLWWLLTPLGGNHSVWVSDHWLNTPVPYGRPNIPGTGNCPGADETPN